MSDTKVKVAVRVRPMNRRGKIFHLYRFHISHIAHLFQRSQKVRTSSPLLLLARFYKPEVRLDRSLKKVSPFCCKLRTPPHSASLSQPNFVCAEIELNTKCVVDMEDNQTVLHPPPSNAKGENR